MKQTDTIISIEPSDSDVDESADDPQEFELRAAPIGAEHHGVRLDLAAAHLVPEFSRSYLQQLIELGLVKLNGKLLSKPSTKVKAGDLVTIELRPTPQSQAFRPEPMDLNVIYKDDHVLVLDKPAGLVVHPAPGNWSGTLLNGLLAHDNLAQLLPRAGIVHRLDKDTSGLMVVARSRAAMDGLVNAIAAHEVSRQYIAIGSRAWTGLNQVVVQAPVGRDPRNRLRMAVVDLAVTGGKSARTDIYLLGNASSACFVRCVLHTGRTHQIRVHMASIGHPLVSDQTYGGVVDAFMPRQALHAYKLAFLHPITGQSLSFEAPPPGDFSTLLQQFGWDTIRL